MTQGWGRKPQGNSAEGSGGPASPADPAGDADSASSASADEEAQVSKNTADDATQVFAPVTPGSSTSETPEPSLNLSSGQSGAPDPELTPNPGHGPTSGTTPNPDSGQPPHQRFLNGPTLPQYQRNPFYEAASYPPQGAQFVPPGPAPQGTSPGSDGHSGYAQYGGYEGHGGSGGVPLRNGGATVAVVVLAILLAIVLGILLATQWDRLFGSGDPSRDNSAATTIVVPAEEGRDDSGGNGNNGDNPQSSGARPTSPALPAGVIPVNQAASSGEPTGNFNAVWLSGPTSESFALAVRDAYVDAYLSDRRTNQTIVAHSSTTSQDYTMTCADKRSYIHCTGGNDASVYIA